MRTRVIGGHINRNLPDSKWRTELRSDIRDEIYQCFGNANVQDVQDLSLLTGFTVQGVVHALRNLEKEGMVFRVSQGVWALVGVIE